MCIRDRSSATRSSTPCGTVWLPLIGASSALLPSICSNGLPRLGRPQRDKTRRTTHMQRFKLLSRVKHALS
eukprot:821269-Alexandrium_andersonii.AAC.1